VRKRDGFSAKSNRGESPALSAGRRAALHFELAKKPVGNEMSFKVTWTVLDKNGLSGDIFVLNSFSQTQGAGGALLGATVSYPHPRLTL
jgi:hypothetical protein